MVIQDVCFVKGATAWEHLPTDGRSEVAFVGRSNVGKSSLLNMLAGRTSLARISRTPGKTQEFNCYLVNDHFWFVDLPGYGYARVMRSRRNEWTKLIVRYLTERKSLRVIFHLIDSRHAPTERDEAVMELMRESVAPHVIVLTKADKLSGNERTRSMARMQRVLTSLAIETPVVVTSAKTKRGREDLLAWIGDLIP